MGKLKPSVGFGDGHVYRWAAGEIHMKQLTHVHEALMREVLVHHSAGGATLDCLKEGVDYRQKIALGDSQALEHLGHLTTLGLVVRDSELYRASNDIYTESPKTPTGQLSFNRTRWRQFWRGVTAVA